MEPTEEEKAKARQTIRLLYWLIAVGMLLPLVLYVWVTAGSGDGSPQPP